MQGHFYPFKERANFTPKRNQSLFFIAPLLNSMYLMSFS